MLIPHLDIVSTPAPQNPEHRFGQSLWHYTRPTGPSQTHSPVQAPEGIRRLALPRDRHRMYRCISGRDSDLEAFSPNPSDGSFAPLAFRPGTYTKCLNLRFLSY
ncbi:uncharacterized protein DEA37_0011153 [Paragonimus westermani]|uniref:Uncharacterized protein n=1 Tax=Paragonimus westermani TaxID=34504 RepID=A0A5J4NCI4_9TREM|nr:uncharacterized protein DEA37_0011153 [Paragonimus westermani]